MKNICLMVFIFIVLLSVGCKKNPTDPGIVDTSPSILVPQGSYPSFSSYLSKYNNKYNSQVELGNYQIPISLKITDQKGSTCMAHATAYTMSISLQNRTPSLFSQMQFDPNFIIDIAFLSKSRKKTTDNYKTFMSWYKFKDVIDFISGDGVQIPYQSNPNITAWGCETMQDYREVDPVAILIAQFYSRRPFNLQNEFWYTYQYNPSETPNKEFFISQMKSVIATNAAIVYLATCSIYFDPKNSWKGNISSTDLVDLSADHAITLIGWDDTVKIGIDTGAFVFLNSHGKSYGTDGKGYISYEFMKKYWEYDFVYRRMHLSQMFVFDFSAKSEDSFIDGFGSFFTEVNKNLRDPFNTSQRFTVDTQKNIDIGYYQGNDKDTRFEIVDLENNIIKEIVPDQSLIIIRKRYRDLKNKTAANILTVNRDDIAHLDTFKIIYYNDNKIADTITLQPQKTNRITHINGVDVKTGTFVAKPDDTLLIAYTKSIRGKAKFLLNSMLLGEVASSSVADGTISLRLPSSLNSGAYILKYVIDDQIWDKINVTVEENISKIVSVSINGIPVSNIYSSPMVRMGDVIRVEIQQSKDGNGKVLFGDVLIGETNVPGTFSYIHTMTTDVSEYISIMLSDEIENKRKIVYNYQNTEVDSFSISPAFTFVDARPKNADDMTKMLMVYNSPSGYFPDDYSILLWFDDALQFQNEIGNLFYGSRMSGDKYRFTSVALDGNFFNSGRLFGGVYEPDTKKRSGKNIKIKNRDIVIGPSDVFLYIYADSLIKKDILYLGVLSPGLIY